MTSISGKSRGAVYFAVSPEETKMAPDNHRLSPSVFSKCSRKTAILFQYP